MKEGDTWNVAAVYCPPGKRYAGRMMQLVGEKVKELNAEASCLWSDVGEKFYAERGWRCFESLEGTITVPLEDDREEERDGTPDVEDITDDNIDTLLAELTARDVTLMREEMAKLGEANPDNSFIAVLPSIAAYKWYFCRSEHDAIPLGVQKPTRWGATVAVADSLSYITWIPNFKLRTLIILRLRAESAKVRRALLRRAVNEALACEFTNVVVVWGTETKVFDEAGVPCTVGPRTDSLSSMAWYGGDVADVVWVTMKNMRGASKGFLVDETIFLSWVIALIRSLSNLGT